MGFVGWEELAQKNKEHSRQWTDNDYSQNKEVLFTVFFSQYVLCFYSQNLVSLNSKKKKKKITISNLFVYFKRCFGSPTEL